MAYCSPSDVAALNKARIIGAGKNPTLADVTLYTNMAAAEIDAILVNKGYQTPIPSQYTEAWNLLNSINAQGGWAKMEAAAENSVNLDRAEKTYEASLQMLRAAAQVMDAPKDVQRAEPRGPGLTTPPGIVPNPADDDPYYLGSGAPGPDQPFFRRHQRF